MAKTFLRPRIVYYNPYASRRNFLISTELLAWAPTVGGGGNTSTQDVLKITTIEEVRKCTKYE
jgi:hypothetical protein